MFLAGQEAQTMYLTPIKRQFIHLATNESFLTDITFLPHASLYATVEIQPTT